MTITKAQIQQVMAEQYGFTANGGEIGTVYQDFNLTINETNDGLRIEIFKKEGANFEKVNHYWADRFESVEAIWLNTLSISAFLEDHNDDIKRNEKNLPECRSSGEQEHIKQCVCWQTRQWLK